jgi:hypothetical protein
MVLPSNSSAAPNISIGVKADTRRISRLTTPDGGRRSPLKAQRVREELTFWENGPQGARSLASGWAAAGAVSSAAPLAFEQSLKARISTDGRRPVLHQSACIGRGAIGAVGSGGACTSMPRMFRNQRSSLTHWWTMCSYTLRPRISDKLGRTGRSSSLNMDQTLTTLILSVSYVSTRN